MADALFQDMKRKIASALHSAPEEAVTADAYRHGLVGYRACGVLDLAAPDRSRQPEAVDDLLGSVGRGAVGAEHHRPDARGLPVRQRSIPSAEMTGSHEMKRKIAEQS